MLKVGYIVGHNSINKGAFSPHLGLSEFDFWSLLSRNLQGFVFHHNSSFISYKDRMKETASIINNQHFDLIISLHFNSHNSSANGSECLFISDAGGLYASMLQEITVGYFKTRDRGIKRLNSNNRGFSEIFYPNAPAVIYEPFFGSNYDDCKKIDILGLIHILNNFSFI